MTQLSGYPPKESGTVNFVQMKVSDPSLEQGTPLVDTERPPTFENLVIRHMPASTRAAPATYGKLTVAVVAPPDK